MKKKFLTAVLAVVMCMGIFAACSNDSAKPTPTLSSISIVNGSFQSTYYVGDTLDLTNAKIKVNMSDGATSETAITAAMVTGFDSSVVAESKKLVVTHKVGEITKTTDFTYKILAAKTVEEKFLEVVNKNMTRPQYGLEIYEIESKKVLGKINTQRDVSGNITYSCMETATPDGLKIYEIYHNNMIYNYYNGKNYYKQSAKDYSESSEMADIIYQLKSFPLEMIIETSNGFKFGDVLNVDIDKTGIITEIPIFSEGYSFKFINDFKKTEPDVSGLIFKQDYNVNVFCGCDIHSGGKFVDNVFNLDNYYLKKCEKAGKEVEYIFIDKNKTLLLDVFTKLTADMNLYVTWRDETASVEWCYVENGSEGLWSRSKVIIGQTVVPYLIRELNNYDEYIEAWFTDKALTNRFDFATPITEDIKLYGKLVPENRKEFSVKFFYSADNGPSETRVTQSIREGDYVMRFDTSKLVGGMIAEGLYADSARTVKFNSKTPITANTELYIKLVPDTRTFHTVTVICGVSGHTHKFKIQKFRTFNGGEFYNECDKNNDLRPYFFSNNDFTGQECHDMPISHDCTLYVKWE